MALNFAEIGPGARNRHFSDFPAAAHLDGLGAIASSGRKVFFRWPVFIDFLRVSHVNSAAENMAKSRSRGEFTGKFRAKFAWMQERKLDFSLLGDCPKFRVNETGTVPFGCRQWRLKAARQFSRGAAADAEEGAGGSGAGGGQICCRLPQSLSSGIGGRKPNTENRKLASGRVAGIARPASVYSHFYITPMGSRKAEPGTPIEQGRGGHKTGRRGRRHDLQPA